MVLILVIIYNQIFVSPQIKTKGCVLGSKEPSAFFCLLRKKKKGVLTGPLLLFVKVLPLFWYLCRALEASPQKKKVRAKPKHKGLRRKNPKEITNIPLKRLV